MNRWQIPYLKIRLQNFSIICTYGKYLTEDKTTKLSIIWTYGKYLTWRYNYKTSPSYEPMANTLLEDRLQQLLHHMNLWQIPYLKIRLRTFSIIWIDDNTLLEDKTTKYLHHMNLWQIPYLKIKTTNIHHHMTRWQIPYLKMRLRTFSIIWTDDNTLLEDKTTKLLHHMKPLANTSLEDKTTKLLHHMNLWQIPHLKIRLQNFSIIWNYGKYLTWR